jgi:hypothetical protein
VRFLRARGGSSTLPAMMTMGRAEQPVRIGQPLKGRRETLLSGQDRVDLVGRQARRSRHYRGIVAANVREKPRSFGRDVTTTSLAFRPPGCRLIPGVLPPPPSDVTPAIGAFGPVESTAAIESRLQGRRDRSLASAHESEYNRRTLKIGPRLDPALGTRAVGTGSGGPAAGEANGPMWGVWRRWI